MPEKNGLYVQAMIIQVQSLIALRLSGGAVTCFCFPLFFKTIILAPAALTAAEYITKTLFIAEQTSNTSVLHMWLCLIGRHLDVIQLWFCGCAGTQLVEFELPTTFD